MREGEPKNDLDLEKKIDEESTQKSAGSADSHEHDKTEESLKENAVVNVSNATDRIDTINVAENSEREMCVCTPCRHPAEPHRSRCSRHRQGCPM